MQADRLLPVAALAIPNVFKSIAASHKYNIGLSFVKIQSYVLMQGIDFLYAGHKIVAMQQFPVESVFERRYPSIELYQLRTLTAIARKLNSTSELCDE